MVVRIQGDRAAAFITPAEVEDQLAYGALELDGDDSAFDGFTGKVAHSDVVLLAERPGDVGSLTEGAPHIQIGQGGVCFVFRIPELDFRLPGIRRKLIEAIDCSRNDVAFAILRFFDEYVAEVHKHMDYEEHKVFPYVEALLAGERPEGYSIDVFRRHHDQVEAKLAELKRIIIRYYPSGSTNELNGVLFDIFTCERDLASHNDIEDRLFIPAIKRLEEAGETPDDVRSGEGARKRSSGAKGGVR